MRTVAVIGAGLSGLTAAFRLEQRGWTAVVCETTRAAGGRVQTYRQSGYQVDLGASAFSGAYAPYLSLVHELGIPYRPTSPVVGIPRDGTVHELNMNAMALSGARTRLLPWADKARLVRLGLDVVRASRRGQLDYSDMRKAAPLDTESARAYARRVLSADLDQYLCEPIVRTMLIADTDKVSKVELFSGIANIFASKIYAIENGQGRVTEALADRLDVRLENTAVRMREHDDGVEVTTRAASGETRSDRFDACVVSTPLHVAAEICPDHSALLQPLASHLGYTQCLKVAIGMSRRPSTDAFLVQFASREDPDVALIFLDHNKASDRAPAGHALFDACWETDASRRMMDASDEEIVERTLSTIYRLYPDLRGAMDFSHVTRWVKALPHTGIGAYRHIGEFNAQLRADARIQFAADYMSAAGQNTAVAFGDRAAQNLHAHHGS
jgi:oxygen-dependent protoporphyrinogen oxidase